jgi:hypothetical protein
MNSSEVSYLVHEKQLEGKSNYEVYKELSDLKSSQIKFKNLNRELKKKDTIIKKLNLKIETINSKLKKDNNKKLIEGLKEESKKDPKPSREPNLLNTKRVINYVELGKRYTRTDLALELRIPSPLIEQILNFLNRYTLIKFQVDRENGYTRIQ